MLNTMGEVVSYNEGIRRCTFCNKSEREVHKLITGAGVAICDECVALCVDILTQEHADEVVDMQSMPTPAQINDILNQYVIGQNGAKRTLSVAVYNHFKRARIESSMNSNTLALAHQQAMRKYTHNDDGDEVRVAKSNILLLGPTGVGKTYLAQTLAQAMDVPFVIADATSLTEAGYVGDDAESMLKRLLEEADGDIERAEHGIIYIDEIDKISRKSGNNTSMTRDVSGEGVQQALLKIIEGTITHVPVDDGKKHRDIQTVQLNTRNILFVCGGAFVGLDDIIEHRLGAHESGFGAAWRTQEVSREQLLRQVNADDLAQFGLLPELIGRLPIITVLDELTQDDLVRILVEPKNALTKQYQKLFALDGVMLTFTDDAVEQIAKTSMEQGTGARGLRAIIEYSLEDTMFALPSMDNVNEVVVNAGVIRGEHAPQIIEQTTQELRRIDL